MCTTATWRGEPFRVTERAADLLRGGSAPAASRPADGAPSRDLQNTDILYLYKYSSVRTLWRPAAGVDHPAGASGPGSGTAWGTAAAIFPIPSAMRERLITE